MKHLRIFGMLLLASIGLSACDAFQTLGGSTLKSPQGRSYELIVVASQPIWEGELGDSLRAVLAAPIPYLPQREPEFDLLRVTPDGFTNLVVDHRNILKVLVDPSIPEASMGVQYNVTADPQIVLTFQGPSQQALIDYLAAHGSKLVQVIQQAERDRAIDHATRYNASGVEKAIKERFGVTMHVPKGYILAANEPDFIWARFEYPNASQGFLIYSYPSNGVASLSEQALTAARARYARRIPGPSDGSYMTNSPVFSPIARTFRLDGRLWVELRGFWDVENDFMGGPFVSYSTLDTNTGYIFTFDCYVYAPKLPPHKRNLMHGLEHLFYTISFPDASDQKGEE